MLDLGGADAEGQRAERAVRGRMRVAADDSHAGQRGALLRADDVDDALTLVAHAEQLDAVFAAIAIQRLDLGARQRIADTSGAARGRHVVICGGQHRAGAPRLAVRQAQAFEGLGRGHLVHHVAIDVEQRGTVALVAHDVLIPDLVVQCLAGHVSFLAVEPPRFRNGFSPQISDVQDSGTQPITPIQTSYTMHSPLEYQGQ